MSNEPKPINPFNEMCYEILIKHPKGAEYSAHIEKMLKLPVAILNKDVSLTWFNEGRNDFIRGMLNGAQKYMNEKPQTDKVKKTKRVKKELIINE